MSVTISTHNGSSVRREHNRRNAKVTCKEPHIDSSIRAILRHESWKDEPITEAYKRIFGEAVDDYNSRQKRSDRRITSYYNHICEDKTKHPCYEMIIGIYGQDCPIDTGKKILKQFVNGWSERNPNLELIGAYYHADEPGAAPHVHIDYIPVAHGYKTGMHTRSALVKALGEQGFIGTTSKQTAQILWEQRENKHLEHLCNAYGLTVDHPAIEGKEHLATAEYKVKTAIADEQQRLKALEAELAATNEQLVKANEQLAAIISSKTSLDTVKVGRFSKKVSIDKDLLEQLLLIKDTIQQELHNAQVLQQLEKENNNLKQKNQIDQAKLANDRKRFDKLVEQQATERSQRKTEALRSRLQQLEYFCKQLYLSNGMNVLESFERERINKKKQTRHR